MIWLIGGAARCGKSTLAAAAQARLKSPVVPLDYLRFALIAVATPANQASLRLSPRVGEHTESEWLAQLRERDRVLWQGARGLIEAALASKSDLIIEGGLWPDYTAEFADYDQVRIVYLTDTSNRAVERIVQLAHNPAIKHNWMSSWSDEQLQKWAQYNLARSRMIDNLAQQHNQPVFDAATGGVDGAQSKALAHLSQP